MLKVSRALSEAEKKEGKEEEERPRRPSITIEPNTLVPKGGTNFDENNNNMGQEDERSLQNETELKEKEKKDKSSPPSLAVKSSYVPNWINIDNLLEIGGSVFAAAGAMYMAIPEEELLTTLLTIANTECTSKASLHSTLDKWYKAYESAIPQVRASYDAMRRYYLAVKDYVVLLCQLCPCMGRDKSWSTTFCKLLLHPFTIVNLQLTQMVAYFWVATDKKDEALLDTLTTSQIVVGIYVILPILLKKVQSCILRERLNEQERIEALKQLSEEQAETDHIKKLKETVEVMEKEQEKSDEKIFELEAELTQTREIYDDKLNEKENIIKVQEIQIKKLEADNDELKKLLSKKQESSDDDESDNSLVPKN